MHRIATILRVVGRLAVTRGQTERRKHLFEEFLNLGGIYVKFLQLLSLNTDFMKGWSGLRERAAFEHVPYETITLEEVIDVRHFHSYANQPFAGGSFAQVYRGVLTNGQPVVIKVLRPSISRYLQIDLRLLNILVRIVSFLWPMSTVDLRALFKEFRRSVYSEVDYHQEVFYAQQLYEYYKSSPTVVVPKTYEYLSTGRVIIQDYIEGVSLAKVIEEQLEGAAIEERVQQYVGSDIWIQLSALGTEFLKSTLTGDYILGDPHPGNIKLLQDNKVGLIDFGLTATAPANRQIVLEMIREYQKLYNDEFSPGTFATAMLAFYDERLIGALGRVMYKSGTSTSLVNIIGQYVEELLGDYTTNARFQIEIREKRMTRLFNSIINEGNRFGVQVNMRNVVLQKAMHTYIGMVADIGRRAPGQKHFEVMRSTLEATLAHVEFHGIADTNVVSMSDSEAYEIVVNWVEQISDRDTLLGAHVGAMI